MRVGSGGVMLPNHAPLIVAEQFGMLEALYPGRIDLGLGRAPGTDRLTARALQRSVGTLSAEAFPEQLAELRAYFDDRADDGSPQRRTRAIPAEGNEPAVWLLGSSGYSAELAGSLGLPFAFAHHFQCGEHLAGIGLVPEGLQAVGGAGETVLPDRCLGCLRTRL